MRQVAPVTDRAVVSLRLMRRSILIVRSLLLGAVFINTVACTLARAPAGKVPRTAEGVPDLSGVWQVLDNSIDHNLEPHPGYGGANGAPPNQGVVQGGRLPYQPWALEKRDANFRNRDKLDPRAKCFTLGTPRAQYYPAPFEILQRPRDLTLVYQFGHSVRTIHTNGTPHPQGGNQLFWLGDSRGRWEGDTLVVDVTDFNDETWFDRAGNFHSDKLRVQERWMLLGPDHLQYTATMSDEDVFTQPWTIEIVLYRHKGKGYRLVENYCFTHEYDRYYPYP